MKKIALIEDRYKRQEHFLEKNSINLDDFADILENFTEEKADNLLEYIGKNSFNLKEFDYIVCHKSVENNTVILGNLKEYCKKHQRTLVLFSGGISVNYYDNSEFELLELNSKTFYSQNLVLFLEAVSTENEDIMMLCYGELWRQNIVANVLENTNYLMEQVEENIVFDDDFAFIDIEKLSKIDYSFYNPKFDNNQTTKNEIEKLRDSLISYFNKSEISIQPIRTLKIHSNNVIDVEFDHEIIFESTDDLDTYISKILINELSLKEFDTIFIKDNLSSNYLELYGLRVAYHIRLSSELANKRFAPIVIISDFDEATLNRFTHEANILFTEGIYLCKNTKDDIKKYQSLKLNALSNYDEFLSHIEVSPPKDTSGTHDIANKWSIYRWTEFLQIEKSEAITKNKNEVENELYFKYAKTLHTKQDIEPKNIIKPTKKGKVLLIDDEWNKGWADILKTALTKDGLEFSAFEYDFKDKSNFNLIVQLNFKELKNLVAEADVVILDLRLIESDHENEDIDNYSGVKILQKIHEINAGIQVIMLTATSKSTILEKLYEKKILGYIKKEHPDDKSIDTVENINKFVRLVDKGLERKYLKKVFLIQKELLALPLLQIEFSFNMDENDKKLLELKNTISKIFETLDSNIPRPFIYGMLTLYKCIETICDYFIYEYYDKTDKKQKAYWRSSDKLISNNGNASVNNKTRNILRLLEINENDTIRLIDELSCSRNYEIHPGEIKPACQERVILKPNETHIIPWFELIKTILNKIGK